MKAKYFIGFIVIGLVTVGAVSAENIQYPISELGNCKSDVDCRAYCDKSKNTDACLSFAQENNLMSAQEIDIAKRFLAAKDTPGRCVGKVACDVYCNDISHINECVPFAQNNNLLPTDQLQEAKKIQTAIANGVKPPSCANKEACDTYCQDPNHMEECIAFGEATGFLQGQELVNAQKVLAAIKSGIKPPPCQGKDACDAYCSNPDTAEACMNFSIAAGMMSEQEKANSQKMLQALKKGIKPPPCKGQQECDAYCSSEEHAQECINFSVAAGMMSEGEAAMARKTGGKGPGGCVGKDACDAFCNNPDNQEACFIFAKDNGMIPEADLKRMEEGRQQMKQTLEQAPAEVLACLKVEVGVDMVEKIKNGVMPPKEMGDKMQTCFQKMGPVQPGAPGSGGMIPPAGQTGPGGCKTAEECQTYCGAHPDECKNFGSGGNQPGPGQINPGGQMMPQQAGPGGCKTPEECQKYCESNQEECKNFYPAGDESLRDQEPQTQQQGQMQPGQQCEGEGCQLGPLPGQQMQPGQELQPGQNSPPPSTGPGAGGNLAPGDTVPQLQPTEQQPQQPAPSENSPPPPPPPPSPVSYIINTDSFVGSLIDAVFKFLTKR